MNLEVDIEALQARLLRGKLTKALDWQLRSIFRWYSKTFHTPLHLVDRLPLEDVLTAYYEENFDNMEDPEIQELVYDLTLTDEEKEAAKVAEVDDDDFFDKMNEEAQAETKEAPKEEPKPAPAVLPGTPIPEEFRVDFQNDNLLNDSGDFDPINLPKKA